jgi:hypothetical protein
MMKTSPMAPFKMTVTIESALRAMTTKDILVKKTYT